MLDKKCEKSIRHREFLAVLQIEKALNVFEEYPLCISPNKTDARDLVFYNLQQAIENLVKISIILYTGKVNNDTIKQKEGFEKLAEIETTISDSRLDIMKRLVDLRNGIVHPKLYIDYYIKHGASQVRSNYMEHLNAVEDVMQDGCMPLINSFRILRPVSIFAYEFTAGITI